MEQQAPTMAMDLLILSTVCGYLYFSKFILISITEAQNDYGVSGAQAFYYAARIYNSGSIPDVSIFLCFKGISTNI